MLYARKGSPTRTAALAAAALSASLTLLTPDGLVGQTHGPGTERCGLLTAATTSARDFPASASAVLRSAEPASETDIIRVDTELVMAEFDVHDKKGRQVLGLRKEEVLVEEDGVEQQIEIFAFGKESAKFGRTIILIIDHSQSQAPYIETSIAAAKILVDMLEPNDRLAIVTDNIELISDFSSDRHLLKSRLDELKDRALSGRFGVSKQMTALYAAVSELFNAREKRPIVIFQTDGDQYPETALFKGSPGAGECTRPFRSFKDLEKLLKSTGATVYSVVPGIRSELSQFRPGTKDTDELLEKAVRDEMQVRWAERTHRNPRLQRSWTQARLRDAMAVARISRITGGISQYLDSPDSASEVYRRILEAMNSRYILGYYPSDTRKTYGLRKIRIKTRADLDYTVTGRTAYLPLIR